MRTRHSREKGLPVAVIALALFFVSGSHAALAADLIAGPATVIDGNTIEIGGQRVVLHGIDAPESAQTCAVQGREVPCGQQAAAALAERIGQQAVTCKRKGRDPAGHPVAVCEAGDDDLNTWMVRQGMALADPRASKTYRRAEKRAAKEKAGLWAGWFVKPWDWRRGRRLTRERVFEENVCAIKGNITQDGKRVYHVPGGQYYGPAIIEPQNGERYFCTEEEARAAGWRKSKR